MKDFLSLINPACSVGPTVTLKKESHRPHSDSLTGTTRAISLVSVSVPFDYVIDLLSRLIIQLIPVSENNVQWGRCSMGKSNT